jgi:nucleotide-binding universal stress UspA family protein
MQRHAEKTLGAVAQAAIAAGIACEVVHVEHEHPYQAIIDTAAAKACDLIVMAAHGRRGYRSWQRHGQGADTFQDPGACPSLSRNLPLL